MTLLDAFKNASKEIALDLEMNVEKIEFEHCETPFVGIDFFADLDEDSGGFSFHLKTYAEDEDPTIGRMKAFLSITYEKDKVPYSFHEDVDYIKKHPKFLSRWCSWAIFNFRQTHQKADLHSLFYHAEVVVWGFPNYGADEEASLLFHGILGTQKGKVLIYRFRHIRLGDLYRSFSHAVFFKPRARGFWVVFPDTCGLDSGGAYSSYVHFEKLIQMIGQKLDVEIRTYDVEYEELDSFLLMNSYSFFRMSRKGVLEMIHDFYEPRDVLEGSEVEYDKFIESLKEKEYAQALRDLRALVQQAQENVAKLKNIDYSSISNPNINKLAHLLIKKKQLNGRLKPWFEAFSSIANIASHRDFPTKQDMKNSVLRTRILLTFYLGLQLFKELDNAAD